MTEIRPWLETRDTPARVRDLLREAQASQPLDARTQARSRRRLVAMSALPAAAGIVFWVKNIALGAVLGGAVVAIAYVPRLGTSTVRHNVTVNEPAAKVTDLRPGIAAAPDAGAEDGGTVTAAVSSAPTPPRSGIGTLPSAEPSLLSRETQLLERARGLMGHDARQALASLDEHQREFPHGALELERELMAVDACLKLGLRQDAQQRAARLRAQAPGSIYERRLTRLLGEDRDRHP